MERKKYVYWEDDDMWLGYFVEYPDYMTQGETLEELKDNLRDIYKDLTPAIKTFNSATNILIVGEKY